MTLRWYLVRGAAALLRLLSFPFLLAGWIATPILFASAWCEDRAREWDPRLWERDQHTDLHPPPGA